MPQDSTCVRQPCSWRLIARMSTVQIRSFVWWVALVVLSTVCSLSYTIKQVSSLPKPKPKLRLRRRQVVENGVRALTPSGRLLTNLHFLVRSAQDSLGGALKLGDVSSHFAPLFACKTCKKLRKLLHVCPNPTQIAQKPEGAGERWRAAEWRFV